MPNAVIAAQPGKLVDTNIRLNPVVLSAVKAQGYTGVIRYVPLPGLDDTNDIHPDELDAIMESGLGLMLVQHVRFPHWDPRDHSGAADAQTAAQFASQVGYLPGAHIFIDLEGIVPGTGGATKAFAGAWAKTIAAAGYNAGCYVGFDVPLTPQELYDLEVINSYWSDAGLRAVAVRGFALKQESEIAIAGVSFDPDTLTRDLKGETPFWMISGPLDVG